MKKQLIALTLISVTLWPTAQAMQRSARAILVPAAIAAAKAWQTRITRPATAAPAYAQGTTDQRAMQTHALPPRQTAPSRSQQLLGWANSFANDNNTRWQSMVGTISGAGAFNHLFQPRHAHAATKFEQDPLKLQFQKEPEDITPEEVNKLTNDQIEILLGNFKCKQNIIICVANNITEVNKHIIETIIKHIPEAAKILTFPDAKKETNETGTTSNQQKYTINLEWINQKLHKDQSFIFPTQTKDSLYKEFLDVIFKWARLNPNSVVNVWFDSALCSANAVKETQKLIKQYSQKHPQIAPIQLRDIRELPHVIKNPDVFSDKTPVYFRADLIRVIAAHNELSQSKTENFVYADLDMEPISYEQLFDKETNTYLKKYGIVMAREAPLGFENGFMIINNNNANLLESIEWTIIDLNIERAYHALHGDFYDISRRQPKGPLEPLEQIILDSFQSMFEYFYFLEGYGTLVYKLNNEENYDKTKHGLKPFGVSFLNWRSLQLKSEIFNEDAIIWAPTKKVNLPAASGKYN